MRRILYLSVNLTVNLRHNRRGETVVPGPSDNHDPIIRLKNIIHWECIRLEGQE